MAQIFILIRCIHCKHPENKNIERPEWFKKMRKGLNPEDCVLVTETLQNNESLQFVKITFTRMCKSNSHAAPPVNLLT